MILAKLELTDLYGGKAGAVAIISPVLWMAEAQVRALLEEALTNYHGSRKPFLTKHRSRKEEPTMAKKKAAKKAAAPKAAKPAKAAKKKAKK